MLSRDFVRNNIEALQTMLKHRNVSDQVDLDTYMQVDAERRQNQQEVDRLRQVRNKTSQEVASYKREKKDAANLIKEMKNVGAQLKTMEEQLRETDEQLKYLELTIPNVFHPSVPVGPDETYNRIEREWGEPPDFPFSPLPHWEIGEKLGILDFQRAAKITGARFAVYRGPGARLERALVNFFLDTAISRGYEEILPPFMANRESCTGTGQLPKFVDDLFHIEGTEYFLVPTAEVPVTNLHRKETLSEEELPVRYCSYTPCFRSEAGSYGKDTRGLIRQHQFNKVELVKFTLPETSYEELESLTKDAERLLQLLHLPYRRVTLCTGDLGFSAAKTYDLEVWIPSQETYREISSCSNFEDFQARRASIRLKREGSTRSEFLHTLNGSALAVGRTVVAILENHQQADGTVVLPDVLVPYMGGIEELTPE